VTLIFTKVMDELSRGLVDKDEDAEAAPTDRAYWEKKGTQATVQLVDVLLGIAREIDPSLAAEIQYFVRENSALSAVSAVVSSCLLCAAAFQKAPFKMTFAGSNPPCPASRCGLSYAILGCMRTAGRGTVGTVTAGAWLRAGRYVTGDRFVARRAKSAKVVLGSNRRALDSCTARSTMSQPQLEDAPNGQENQEF
jgi:hypothetical protein